MSRTLFENSKAALAFAGMTILGAVAMVGTSEDGGVLGRTVESLAAEPEASYSGAQDFADQNGPGDRADTLSAGSGSSEAVFGDYNPADPVPPATFNEVVEPGTGLDRVVTDGDMMAEPNSGF